jgi:hypothetical protein
VGPIELSLRQAFGAIQIGIGQICPVEHQAAARR